MLTVKVRLPDGSEYVKEVSSVWFNVSKTDEPKYSVCYYEAKGMPLGDRIEEGDIFVMNENGKTIANYHLHYPVPTTNLVHFASNGNPLIQTSQ